MLIPSGYTPSGVMWQIDVVVNRIAPRYVFHGYTLQDIKQESFIICMDALGRYELGRPLENFLSVNLSNRLKNFIRDNYYFKDDNEERIKVIQPGQLENDTLIVDHRKEESKGDKMDYNEMTKLIDRALPASMRADYLKIKNEVYIPRSRYDEIIEEVKEILKEGGLYEER